MKFAEHLLAHITPEWRRQYIVYEDMKTMLYEAVENIPSIEMASVAEISRLVRAFDEDFMAFCEKELFKINVFYEEKLAEAKRKFDSLRNEIDALALEYNQVPNVGNFRYQNYLRNSISQRTHTNALPTVSGGNAAPSNASLASLASSANISGSQQCLASPQSSSADLRLQQQLPAPVPTVTTTTSSSSTTTAVTTTSSDSLAANATPDSKQQQRMQSLAVKPHAHQLTHAATVMNITKCQQQQQQQQQQQSKHEDLDDVYVAIKIPSLNNERELHSSNNNKQLRKRKLSIQTRPTVLSANSNISQQQQQQQQSTVSNSTTSYGTISRKLPFTHKARLEKASRAFLSTNFSKNFNNATNNQTTLSNSNNNNNNNYSNNHCGLSSLPNIDKKKLNDIKLAFSEFYLSLVLLQNYQRLNFTGFRKIFKKHDKLIGNEEGKKWMQAHVECAFFHTNKDVDKLIEQTESIVTLHLEAGDRQRAMKKLRVPPLNDAPQPWTAFRVGLYLGAFVVLIISVALTGAYQQTGNDWRIVFRLYRSSLFLIFFIFLVGINIYGWRAHGVNHVLIFELDPRDHLGCQDLLEIAFSFGVLWCVSVLLFLWSTPLGIPPLINPAILNIVLIAYLLNPTRTFHYSARFWLIRCIFRTVTAPCHRVRFCDFWLADQLNSLVPILLDIEYTSCFYLTSTDLYGNVDLERCVVRERKDLVLRAIVACLPAWWRFAQCARRYFDEGHRANPHLLNAGKYSTVWLVVLFSMLTEIFQDDFTSQTQNPFFICWVLSLFISSTYTYTWDIKMDFGLLDKKAPPEYRFLREELVYPVKQYYIVIIEDLLLRFGWTINLSLTKVGGIPTDVMTLVLAPCEIFRRFVWNFYRLENEHLNNCGEFRAVRDISISGQNIDMSALDRILRIMDEPDGLTSFRSKVKARMTTAKKKSILINDQQQQQQQKGQPSDPSLVLII